MRWKATAPPAASFWTEREAIDAQILARFAPEMIDWALGSSEVVMRTTLFVYLSSLALAACSSTPPPNDESSANGTGTSAGGSGTGAGASGSGTGADTTGGTGTSGGSSSGGGISSGTSTGAGIEAGTLWIGGANAFGPEVLAKSATTPAYTYTCAPVDTLAHPAQGGAEVIDSQGQLWTQFLTSAPSNTLSMWTPGQLADNCSSRHATVTLSIAQGSFANLAFDPSNNLWASAPTANELLGYSASTLLTSGSIGGPNYLLTQNPKGGASSLFNPTGLAFDTTGTLWVANYYSILAYHTGTLLQAANTGAGNPLVAPDLVLTNPQAANVESDGGLYNQYVYQYLAFDGSGNLWATVENYLNGPVTSQIIEFSASQLSKLATSNQPTPIFTINQPTGQASGFAWSAIAFDSSGNLWAGSHLAAPNLYRYPAATLIGSGTPDIIITALGDTDMNRAFTLAFDPSTLAKP
jgi:hypothetical protein